MLELLTNIGTVITMTFASPEVQMGLVFLVVIGALILFVSEILPVDISAFVILVTLIGLGLIFPDAFPTVSEGLSGLANIATITVLSMFILSAGVQKTGVISKLGRYVFGFVGNSELRQMLAIGLLVAPISGFVNNTAAVAIMLPMVVDLARRSGTAATKLLMPLSFFGMLGGTLTLIGTSTNILAASIFQEEFGRQIGMFEFVNLGLIVLFVGFIYFLTVGRWLLPDRKSLVETEESDVFLTEVVIEKESSLIGKTLKQAEFAARHGVEVIKLIREDKSYIRDASVKELEEGDILTLKTDEQQLIDLQSTTSVRLLPDFDESARRRRVGSSRIIKVMLKSKFFHNKTLEAIDFWARMGVAAVGMQMDVVTTQRLADARLQVGEVMLVQGSNTAVKKLMKRQDILILEEIEDEYDSSKQWTALGIVVAVVLLAAITGIPIVLSALLGVLAMFLTKCLEKDELYDAVSWDVIFLLAGVIPLGIAMQKSGAAQLVAEQIVSVAGSLPAILIIMLLYLVTTLMTEIVSNNASVAILVPIAISVGTQLGVDPFALVLTVMFAASTSFLTPVGYQTNTMIYGAGNYRFGDFIRVGGPLNLILLVVTSIGIVMFWGL